MDFDLPVERSSIIKILGIGGGGNNAVTHMYNQGIKDVNFVVCNTDAQALTESPVPVKVQIGESLTEGRGAGSKPDTGKLSAEENIEEVMSALSGNTRMVFITTGMGGGTGTGAAPVIAGIAKEMGILTVAIVTIPFRFEGSERINQAIEGINELKDHVDSLLVINNEKLREIYGNLTVSNAFEKADDVLAIAAKGIAEIITVHGYINVDFADVQTVMNNSGVAIMGSATASGENRAKDAIATALTSPLLNNNDIQGARSVLLNITSGNAEITMDEISEITDYVVSAASRDTSLIWGIGQDESLGDEISVTIIATGFLMNSIPELYTIKRPTHKLPLRDEGSTSKDRPSNVVPHQASLDFGVKNLDESEEYILMEQKEEQGEQENKDRQLAERVRSLRETHEKLKDRGYLSRGRDEEIEELENVPAYVRKKVAIEQQKHSDEQEVSRYRLSDGEGKDGEESGPKLRPDNTYLHDNVD